MHTSLVHLTYAFFHEACAELNVQCLGVILEAVSTLNHNVVHISRA